MSNAHDGQTKHFSFTVWGTAAEGQSWETTGTVQCAFLRAFDESMRAAFQNLTHGKAIFGQPGVGCHGPYDIHKILIEQVRQ